MDSSPETLDQKYEQYKNSYEALEQAQKEFEDIIGFIKQLSLDYEKHKRLLWTTHLYTLFSVAWYCV